MILVMFVRQPGAGGPGRNPESVALICQFIKAYAYSSFMISTATTP